MTNLFGVILLFYFAMPYRTRQTGDTLLPEGEPLAANLALDRKYDFRSKVGIGFVTVGTVLQSWGAFLAGTL